MVLVHSCDHGGRALHGLLPGQETDLVTGYRPLYYFALPVYTRRVVGYASRFRGLRAAERCWFKPRLRPISGAAVPRPIGRSSTSVKDRPTDDTADRANGPHVDTGPLGRVAVGHSGRVNGLHPRSGQWTIAGSAHRTALRLQQVSG